MIGQQIHDKLITDFAALQFEGGNTLFNNVKKFYAAESMEAQDCLIIPDTNQETVEGQSAGNFQTTREYSFAAVMMEQIESTDDDAAGALKYSRLMNEVDAVLDYLQKEPSNLNSWGDSNDIAIFKIRVRQVIFDRRKSKSGYAEVANVIFGVFLNVIPQNL